MLGGNLISFGERLNTEMGGNEGRIPRMTRDISNLVPEANLSLPHQ